MDGRLAPLQRNRWFADSPLEGTGFELPVRGCAGGNWMRTLGTARDRLGFRLEKLHAPLGDRPRISSCRGLSRCDSRLKGPRFERSAPHAGWVPVAGAELNVRIHSAPPASQRRTPESRCSVRDVGVVQGQQFATAHLSLIGVNSEKHRVTKRVAVQASGAEPLST